MHAYAVALAKEQEKQSAAGSHRNQEKRAPAHWTINAVFAEACVTGSIAVIVVEPTAAAVTTPLEPSALLMVATPVFVEPHVTNDVRSSVEPSVYVPAAVNGCVVPTAMLELTGVTVMETSGVLVTISLAVLEALFTVSTALMMNVPVTLVSSEVARPCEPMLLLTGRATSMGAPVSSDELQVTADVQLSVVLSVNVAVAVNCCVVPAAMIAVAGVMEIDFSVPLRIQLIRPIAVAESRARTTTQYFRNLIFFLLKSSPYGRAGFNN